MQTAYDSHDSCCCCRRASSPCCRESRGKPHCLVRFGRCRPLSQVQDVLREADVNHDGHVDFDEWLKVVAPLQDDLGKYDTRLGGKKA